MLYQNQQKSGKKIVPFKHPSADQARVMRVAGASYREIAKAIGVSPEWARYIVRGYFEVSDDNVQSERLKRIFKELDGMDVAGMFAAGRSVTFVAAQIDDCSAGLVERWMRARGVSRPQTRRRRSQ